MHSGLIKILIPGFLWLVNGKLKNRGNKKNCNFEGLQFSGNPEQIFFNLPCKFQHLWQLSPGRKKDQQSYNVQ
jgi:hypothetical protein